eukprot:2593097-Karenia_brevis.AAC.1
MDAGIFTHINLGSDHRAIYTDLMCQSLRKKNRWRGGKSPQVRTVGWKPAEVEKYKKDLDTKLADILRGETLQSKQASLQDRL